MELALASAIGVLAGIGIYLLLRARSFDVILGMTFLSYATNLLIFSAGRPVIGKAPVLKDGVATSLAHYTDPLPQALVLTAIVIGFALMCFALVLVMQLVRRVGTDDALALRLVEPEPADPVKPPLAFDAVHADDDARPQRADT